MKGNLQRAQCQALAGTRRIHDSEVGKPEITGAIAIRADPVLGLCHLRHPDPGRRNSAAKLHHFVLSAVGLREANDAIDVDVSDDQLCAGRDFGSDVIQYRAGIFHDQDTVNSKKMSDTPTAFGGERNPPIFVYDCSGPYTDPRAKIDIRSGLPALRQVWIEERGDSEFYVGRLRVALDDGGKRGEEERAGEASKHGWGFLGGGEKRGRPEDRVLACRVRILRGKARFLAPMRRRRQGLRAGVARTVLA